MTTPGPRYRIDGAGVLDSSEDKMMDDDSVPEGYKKCAHCGEILPIEEFHKGSCFKDGHDPRCKECMKKVNAEKDKKNHALKLACCELIGFPRGVGGGSPWMNAPPELRKHTRAYVRAHNDWNGEAWVPKSDAVPAPAKPRRMLREDVAGVPADIPPPSVQRQREHRPMQRREAPAPKAPEFKLVEPKNTLAGKVYLMWAPEDPKWMATGSTNQDANVRRNQYNTHNRGRRYQVVGLWHSPDCEADEHTLQADLHTLGYQSYGEFFRIPKETALEIFEEYFNSQEECDVP